MLARCYGSYYLQLKFTCAQLCVITSLEFVSVYVCVCQIIMGKGRFGHKNEMKHFFPAHDLHRIYITVHMNLI